jgi:histidinol dehydrogenase
MVTPTPRGERNGPVLAAAALAGVDRIFRVGGAQAVGALAFGTESVPAVDKIVGPGNAYVASAKRRVFGRVGIDMVAGPSEVLVIADASAHADWVAMDLFSQAEHDEIAQAILLSPTRHSSRSRSTAPIGEMPRRENHQRIARRPRRAHPAPDLTRRMLANRIAPEHLVSPANRNAPREDKARRCDLPGAPRDESLGDGAQAQPRAALAHRAFLSPLGVRLQKRSSVIGVSPAAAKAGARSGHVARAEGLEAHARSAEFRVRD